MEAGELKSLAHWLIFDYGERLSKFREPPEGWQGQVAEGTPGNAPGQDRMAAYYLGSQVACRFLTEEQRTLWERLIVLYRDILQFSRNPGERLQDELRQQVAAAKGQYQAAFPD